MVKIGYGFVDTIERPSQAQSSIKTFFDGYTLDNTLTDHEGRFLTLTVSGRNTIINRIETQEVSHLDGLFEPSEPFMSAREITVRFLVEDDTNEGFQKRLIKLNSLLTGSKKVLYFTDEEVFYYATLLSAEYPEEDSNRLVGNLVFLCTDPYKYSKEEKEYTLEDISLIENKGNEPTEPIIELTALKPTTYAMVENGLGEYNLVGFPLDEDGQEEVVDDRVSIFREDGSTLEQWSTTNHKVDTNFIDVSGSMTSDGSGIRAGSYGTGSKMHGPAITKELPKAIQDFEITADFDIISRREIENWRMEVYFLDENLNMLGKMGIKDNSRAFKRRFGLGRVGHYRGSGKENGYAIGGQNYKRDVNVDATIMHLRVIREGNLYKFFIGRWRTGRYQWTLEQTYRDVDNQFAGKLKFITLFIGSYQDRPVPFRARINSVEVFELKQLTVDQTPYIMRAGDTITFDHKQADILINGENAMFLKDMGATESFWRLLPGHNNVIISPPDTFTGKIKFREKYK